jgi:F0F1-type ATP synthase assembly protein I
MRSESSTYRYAGLGLTFAFTLLAFAGIGYWLDERFGTSPWLLIAGVFLGFAGALYSLIHKVAPVRGRSDQAPPQPPSP